MSKLAAGDTAVASRFSYKRQDVVETLERRPIIQNPNRSSPGVHLRDIDLLACQKRVIPVFSLTGKPLNSAFIASFSGKFRADCLNFH